MSYFIMNEKKIYYHEVGQGRPVVLLHGNTASSNMFYTILPALEHDFHVLVLDFLGHGQSDRLDVFPTDLWYEEAQQVIALLTHKKLGEVDLIGTSGGALVAINVALERPDLVNKVIADSFEGEVPLSSFVENIITDREVSKHDENSIAFYRAMHKDDWESVVDLDTQAIYRHNKEIGHFFHKPVSELTCDILLTGSKEDEFITSIHPEYFQETYGEMIAKMGHGTMYLFNRGRHPAMLSNSEEFIHLAKKFLLE